MAFICSTVSGAKINSNFCRRGTDYNYSLRAPRISRNFRLFRRRLTLGDRSIAPSPADDVSTTSGAFDKKLLLFEGGHRNPETRPELVSEIIGWFDHYLGPVKEP